MSSLRDELIDILSTDLYIAPDRLTPEAELIGGLGFDSVNFSMAMAAVEEHLGIALPEEDVLGCRTFGDLEALVARMSGHA
ncbi:acyl carrier protein [Nocardia sp. NPDC002869]|uniref:acyl carrier protein n=1 Tax=Nocardia sp. NPDC002869 TaxID=3161032 RepID=UPI00398CEC4E